VQLVEPTPVLAKLPVPFEGKQLLPREVVALCTDRSTQTLQLMKELAPLIKFEDGPKRSFETGKLLVQQGKKAEALNQYNECIATGRILQHDRPEMAEQKFEVGGASMSLAEVISACVAQSRKLSDK
jgi:succinate dehydrogenase/fumarate reductase-like Fe-S protein